MEQPIIIPINASQYRLLADYRYEWDGPRGRHLIVVPSGAVTDGASVPRILWSLTGITPDGLHRPAAIVHDWLYDHAGRIETLIRADGSDQWNPSSVPWSRYDADRIFARILREVGVSRIRRRLMYRGVRVGGWWPWWLASRRLQRASSINLN